MKSKNIPSELKQAFIKANMRLKECPTSPLAADQKRKIDAADEAVRACLEKMDKAYRLSRKSTLRFGKNNEGHTR